MTRMTAIADAFEFVRNGASIKQSESATGIPITRIETIWNSTIDKDRLGYADINDIAEYKNYLLEEGDILMSHINSPKHLGKCALYNKLPDSLIHGMNLLNLRPNKKVIAPEYVYFYFSSNGFKQLIAKISNQSVNQASFSAGNLKKLKIPLPPLAEQQKIAAILDAADSLRQKDRQLIEKYTTLSQSLFLGMFGDPVTNPMGWEVSSFGESLIDIVGGKSVGGEERLISAGEKAVLKISAVTSGNFNPTQYKIVEPQELPENLIHPQKGDLLFSRANTREMVGATCIVDAQYENFFLPDKLWRLDLKSDKASNWYIKFLLTHDGFRENLRKVATGTSGSMLNISKAKLTKLNIPLAPVTLQNQFAERIQLIEQQKQQAHACLEKSEALFNSLLQRAFTGELTQHLAA
jgi:type I restriction enzyme S subunit